LKNGWAGKGLISYEWFDEKMSSLNGILVKKWLMK
jgi:hypothetical protein